MHSVKSQVCFLTPRQFNPGNPLFVFLPGMDGTGQLLRSQTESLEPAFDIRCLAIPPDDLTSWHVLAEKVIQLIATEREQHPSSRPVYLCGESFGGCLALKIAIKAPDLFDRLILVNPASSFRQRPWIHWGSYLTRWLPESLYHVSSVGLLPFLASFGRIGASDRQALLEAVQSVPQETSIWRLSLLSEFEVSEQELSQICQPVLLLASVADRLLPSFPEAQRLATSLPNAKIVTLPDSGHACLLEADINLYGIMQAEDFLQRHSEPVLQG